ncbi:MAG: CoA-binding protein [Chloroflexi bacterium]|nr:CoA-binding protein [Chloroflexota bacterium]MCL5110832.1 CoA-binding protein [Chloroflexota bacterium]
MRGEIVNDEQTIDDILHQAKNVAVVGLSDNRMRPSFGVAEYLQKQGYHIIPVNPGVEQVLGEKSYPDLASVPEQIDVVDVFRRPEHVPAIVEEAIKAGARSLWLQDGVGNPEVEKNARQAGLRVVADTCMMREHRRLRREGKI